MDERKFITININELNLATKRRKIFHKLEKLKPGLICMQEVHIKKQHEYLLKQQKLGKLFTALAQCKKKSVVLYIKDTILAEQIYTYDDRRILMVEIMDNNIKTLLIAIYAPNNNQEDFYRKLHMKIIELDYANICIMGDLSGIVNDKLDYKSQKTTKKIRKILPKSFFQMIDEINLKDVW
uniref:Endonuclease/exonuclease/phosphatase domain-containing protein n=1 Tax=Micrurus corallinus TaxID=54390 RepID=A0A2D4EZW5_MICCO